MPSLEKGAINFGLRPPMGPSLMDYSTTPREIYYVDTFYVPIPFLREDTVMLNA
jgi:hypothetical protein